MPLLKLSVILGGAASGKSRWAEGMLEATGRPLLYVATAEARDGEMGARIARHRARRGAQWRDAEAPLDPGAALMGAGAQEAVLLDCATLWLSNLLLAGEDLAAAELRLFAALDACAAPVAVVSNEVGMGVVPDTPLGRRFRDAQGGLNERLAQRAGLVVLVAAGLPLALKGSLP